MLESLLKITSFKHDGDKSIEQNYNNILAAIVEYNIAVKVKTRWVNILKTKEDALNKIKTISAIGGRNVRK